MPDRPTERGPSTRCVHAGLDPEDPYGAVISPIYRAATYLYPREDFPLRYSRWGNNPTQEAVGRMIAELEGTEAGLAFGSGMAAISTGLLALLEMGTHLVASNDLYGATYQLIKDDLPRRGIAVTMVDPTDLEAWRGAIRPETRLLYLESPTNPINRVVDLRAVAKLAAAHEIPVMIDNTFATPINQRPSELGVALIAHSATKYLGGHSDLVAGLLAGPANLIEQATKQLKAYGGAIDPEGAYLLLRGVRTLALRVERQNANGQAVGEFLAGHARVSRVFYPGLPSDPFHRLAAAQMSGFGGIVAAELTTNQAGLDRFLDRLKLITVAPSLGGVESLVSQPSKTSHSYLSFEDRAELRIPEICVRFALGIEEVEDLIADIEQALEAI